MQHFTDSSGRSCVSQQSQKEQYLVGAADQFEDVHLWVRIPIVCKQGMQVGDGGQGAVLIGHAVQVSSTYTNITRSQKCEYLPSEPKAGAAR